MAVDPKILALAEKLLAKKEVQAEKRMENLAEKYPHADPSTIQFDPAAGKFSVVITCTLCGEKGRRVFTSDLFQVKTCVACSELAKKEARTAKKAELKAAMELIRSQRA